MIYPNYMKEDPMDYYEKGLNYLERSNKWYNRFAPIDDDTILDQFNKAKNIFKSQKKYNMSIKCCKKMYNIFSKQNDKYNTIKIGMEIASLHVINKNINKGIRWYDNTSIYSMKEGDNHQMIKCFEKICEIYKNIGNTEGELNTLKKIQNNTEENSKFTQTLNRMIEIYIEIENFEMAIETLNKLIDISENNKILQYSTNNNIYKIMLCHMVQNDNLSKKIEEYISKISSYKYSNEYKITIELVDIIDKNDLIKFDEYIEQKNYKLNDKSIVHLLAKIKYNMNDEDKDYIL